MSEPTRTRILEALELTRTAHLHWNQQQMDAEFLVREVARAYADLLCEPCDGRGHDDSKFCPAGGWDDLKPGEVSCHLCPSCGGSGHKPRVVIDEAMIQRAARALEQKLMASAGHAEDMAAVVLRAALEDT